MTVGIFGRYVAWRFIAALLAVFGGVFLLIVLIDYIELSRRTASLAHVTAGTVAMTSLFRVPQITERLLPFSVLIAAMSAFLTLSRRNELVIARSAGLSAWQFIAPAVFAALAVGLFATAVYNPLAAHLGEQAKQLEAFIFGSRTQNQSAAGSWIRQRTGDGQSILHARSSLDQGRSLAGISVFILDPEGGFARRIEAEKAIWNKASGVWTTRVSIPPQPRRKWSTRITCRPTCPPHRSGKAFPPPKRSRSGSSQRISSMPSEQDLWLRGIRSNFRP